MLKFLFASVLMAYASWQDMRTREIEERIWAVMAGAGILTCAYDSYVAWDVSMFLKMAGVTAGIAVLMLILFRLGLFGFADVEALVALSTLYPLREGFFLPFPISVFNNAVLFTAFLPISIFAYNLARRQDLSAINDRFYKKMMLLFLGYRIPLSRLDENNFPLIWEGKLRFFIPIEYDFSGYKEKAEKEGTREVWVTPGIPFILSLTAGFLAAYFWGDLILKVVFLLLR